ncbi:hypothetical protein PTTG_09894 [Puccinia triticina 1-1 BBBD Race 1]|uniref:Uncharacterized protein n=1 Tax=Puccinia triticina (isolate 1-1 / race 1 (BBBD)) TaxID=630390 RepID=A0A180GAT4_PUCT1|nr:hypothetical protein PTTG_09894 [Puccinia triticina 1-1 BBBD Race 1]
MPPKKRQTQSDNTTSQAKKKKAPVAWDKDGENSGDCSIRILLDWLAVEGNYERWRGNNKTGSTKSALANEILGLMADAGITHRDNKGVQTKMQELQNLYSKASDFLRNKGSGLQEDDIANGTTTLQIALTKICKYWDELSLIMGTRTVATPLHTIASHQMLVPNLLRDGLPSPEIRDSEALQASSKKNACVSSEPNDNPTDNDEQDDPDTGRTSSPGPTTTGRRGGTKKKAGGKKLDPLGLEKVLAKSNIYWRDCYEARKKRDEDKSATEKKCVKLEDSRNREMLEIKKRRVRVLEMEAQMKARRTELDEVCERIAIMKELSDMGHSKKEIAKFMKEQFKQDEGSSKKKHSDNANAGKNDSDEGLDNSSDGSSDDMSNNSSNDSN